MPNWCENRLTVNGQEQGLDIFTEFAKGEDSELTANAFVPYPKEFVEMDRIAREYMKEHPDDWAGCPKDGFNQGGYEWCCEFWGTKWDLGECMADRINRNTLIYCFDTAWSPPGPVIEAMGKMFPALSFKLEYWESGCCFQGELVVQNGQTVLNETRDYYAFDGDEDEGGDVCAEPVSSAGAGTNDLLRVSRDALIYAKLLLNSEYMSRAMDDALSVTYTSVIGEVEQALDLLQKAGIAEVGGT